MVHDYEPRLDILMENPSTNVTGPGLEKICIDCSIFYGHGGVYFSSSIYYLVVIFGKNFGPLHVLIHSGQWVVYFCDHCDYIILDQMLKTPKNVAFKMLVHANELCIQSGSTKQKQQMQF